MGDPKHSDGTGQRADLASLRARVRAIERGGAEAGQSVRFPLGHGALDDHLDGGLAMGRIHELVGEARSELRDGSVFGFAAAMLVRLLSAPAARRGGQILWCARDANMFGGAPCGWGLKALGLDPERVLFVRARDEAERLWAMEEGLRCGGLVAVVAELGPARPGEAGRVAERRLQLAAEASGVTGILLRPLANAVTTGVADSRWRIAAAPSGGSMLPSWSVSLERLRGGRPGAWQLLWTAAHGRFRDLEECASPPEEVPEVRPAAAQSAAA
ncbi:ImuA family protein [Nisaea sp.]|uniref:ImuA family protein n=1 Tax=Nisaea sp. TaxID=2024842 RepID=UPI003B520BB7